MKTYGLIGKSLSHSFSQKYFRKKFEAANLNADYLNFECETLADIKILKQKPALSGLNVTIPYKKDVMSLLDSIDEEAAIIGAVNTIKIEENKWRGYNTDAFGFKQMIAPYLKSHHHKALIFGTGGASKAVEYVLESIGLEINYVSRKPVKNNQFPYNEVNENMIDFHGVLVNTTPLGTHPNINDHLDLPYSAISEKHLVIDLIYNPSETKFLSFAKQNGAKTLNGLTMLEQQAEKSWKIWND